MLEFKLDDLGWERFEQVVQTLLKARLGLGVEAWGGSGDWGRDAYFHGKLNYPTNESREGAFVFQCKFVEAANAAGAKPEKPILDAVRKECARIKDNLGDGGNWRESPTCYAFFTNSPLTPKTRNKIEQLLASVLPASKSSIHDGHDICQWLRLSPDILESFGPLNPAGNEKLRAVERRWQYIQSHPITRVEILLLLKSNVGFDWLCDLLNDCQLNIGRDEHTFRLSTARDRASEPNSKEIPRNLKTPICSFWEIYPHEADCWFKEIAPASRQFTLVAGFDAALPWADLGVASITKLQDLAMLTDVGVSLPPRAFRVGVEEFEVRFVGETFSFSFRMSDHNLDVLHEFARQVKNEDLMNFGGHVDGVHLLESFHRQMFPHEAPATSRKRGIFGGMSGPDGRAISFYPSMPKGFNSTAESKKYSFTISLPKEVDSEAAIRDLEAKIRKNPKAPLPYGRLAALYSQAGRMSDAMSCLEMAFKEALPMAELRGLMAQLLMEVGRLDEALVQLRAAEALAPENAMVQTKLGVCLSELDRDDEALTHFQIAVQSEPDSAQRQFNLSMALAKLGKYPDALTAAACAVRLAPDTPRAERHLGLILSVMGKHADALPHLEKATQLEADCPQTHRNYAISLAELNQHDKAVVHFRKSIVLDETARIQMELSASLAALERWDEAETACRRAVELEPDNADMLVNLASALAKLGKMQEALEICRRSSTAKATARSYSLMSAILAELGDVVEAENALRKGLALDPEDTAMLTNLGVFLANRGQVADAIKHFEQMLQQQPDASIAKKYLEQLMKLPET